MLATMLGAACGPVGSEGDLDPDGGGDDAGSDGSTEPSPKASVDSGAGDAGRDAPGDARIDGCPAEMARITDFCVDRYEAHVVTVTDGGAEVPRSPYALIADASVRAKSAPDVVPQAYISQVEASAACAAAGKRLCSAEEFALACRGADAGAYYPYGGTTYVPGRCNEGKGSYVGLLFGPNPANWTYANFNDPRLNQIDGGLAKTGSYAGCKSPYGVYDCVGNLHEWGSDPPDGRGRARFRGGFYGDAERNGRGCLYVTSAHEPTYHDYSTGFRCCMEAGR